MKKPRDIFGAAAIVAGLDQDDSSDREVPSASKARSAPGRLMEFSGVTKDLEAATRELDQLRKQASGGFEVELSKLRTSPYQTAGLQPARVLALVENLRNNPLATPITVRPTSEEGVYEILTGHHRAEAFRQLGRLRIRAVLKEYTDDEAERLVFYDNLMAPTLSDFEKYLGFSRRQKSKALTLEQLAEESGISKAHVSRYLSYDRLPAGAQQLIREQPSAPGLGAALWAELAALPEKYADRVVIAVQRVAGGKLAATAAAKWVLGNERAAPVQAERTLVKRGRHSFAEVRSRGTQWTVTFKSAEDAEQYSAKLLALIQDAASESD